MRPLRLLLAALLVLSALAGRQIRLPAPALAQSCTIYTAPSALGTGSGADAADPKAFSNANVGVNASVPAGAVVCLETTHGPYTLGSTFYPHAGTASAPVTYESTGGGNALLLWQGGQWSSCTSGDCAMVHLYYTSSTDAYVVLSGLTFDGSNDGADTISSEYASVGVREQWSNHVTVQDCVFEYLAAAGISSTDADYLVADHDQFWLNGYHYGGPQNPPGSVYDPSAISYNTTYNEDGTTSAYHNLITDNIIGGQDDAEYLYSGSPCTNNPCQVTDGNAIIVDLMKGGESTSGSPTLVAGNVVYENGGRGVECNLVADCDVINNTAYQDTLLGQTCTTQGSVCSALADQTGEFVCNGCTDSAFINNAAWAWIDTSGVHPGRATYEYMACQSGCDAAADAGNVWSHDASTNGGAGACQGWTALCVPSDQQSAIQARTPAYDAPTLDAALASPPQQMSLAPAPWALGHDFQLGASDPLAGAGVNPTTVAGIPVALDAQLASILATDLAGTSRTSWDEGAFAAPPPPPTATPTPTVTNTPTITSTPTRTATPTVTFTATPTSTFTFTATPTATFTATPTSTFTATPTNTFTATPTSTFTATPTSTFTPTATFTATATSTPTPTFTVTPITGLPAGTYRVETIVWGPSGQMVSDTSTRFTIG